MGLTYQEFIDSIIKTRGHFGCGEEYHERHHIVPKCMGGSNDEENLIDLFAREHFDAHRLLALENPTEEGLIRAWYLMSHVKNQYEQRVEITKEEYEEARIAFAELMREKMTGEGNPMYGRTGELSPLYGCSPSESHRAKISKTLTGKYEGELAYWYGKHLNEDTRAKISEKAKKDFKTQQNIPCMAHIEAVQTILFMGINTAKRLKTKLVKQDQENPFRIVKL